MTFTLSIKYCTVRHSPSFAIPQLSTICYIWVNKRKKQQQLRDAPLDFKGGAGSFCKKKNLTHSKVKKKKKKLDPHIEGKKNLTHMGRKKNLSCSGEKKTYPHIEEGEKVHTWNLSYSEGRGEATLKRRVSF